MPRSSRLYFSFRVEVRNRSPGRHSRRAAGTKKATGTRPPLDLFSPCLRQAGSDGVAVKPRLIFVYLRCN